MKILLHSAVFWPSIGGIESVSHSLASAFARLGHHVTIITDTASSTERSTAYRVYRSPAAAVTYGLVKSHDIVFANGTVMQLFPLARLLGKPFVWTHQTYRFHFPDGQLDTTLPPDSPAGAALRQAVALRGLPAVAAGFLKLQIRRTVGQLADANIAITEHMKTRQPVPNQRVLYNPVDVGLFRVDNFESGMGRRGDFTFGFLGRMVSDKGVQHLLKAFAALLAQEENSGRQPKSRLKLIGDGPQKEEFQRLAQELGIAPHVTWIAAVSGSDLINQLTDMSIFVVPSFWEEPMGIVAVELAAAGKPLIVSRRGGLAECLGGNCLTFENGDVQELFKCMLRLRDDVDLQRQLATGAFERVANFDAEVVARQYLELFANLIQAQKRL